MASAPPSVMRRAAQGGLSLPASEAIEILVALAGASRTGSGGGSRRCEAGTRRSLVEVASDAGTPPEVLRHLLKLHGQRPAVVEALCENPALALEELEAAASHAGGEVLRAMMRSERVRNSSRLLELMSGESGDGASAAARWTQWLADSPGQETAEDAAESFLTAARGRGGEGG